MNRPFLFVRIRAPFGQMQASLVQIPARLVRMNARFARLGVPFVRMGGAVVRMFGPSVRISARFVPMNGAFVRRNAPHVLLTRRTTPRAAPCWPPICPPGLPIPEECWRTFLLFSHRLPPWLAAIPNRSASERSRRSEERRAPTATTLPRRTRIASAGSIKHVDLFLVDASPSSGADISARPIDTSKREDRVASHSWEARCRVQLSAATGTNSWTIGTLQTVCDPATLGGSSGLG
jgi:hypothetical protein